MANKVARDQRRMPRDQEDEAGGFRKRALCQVEDEFIAIRLGKEGPYERVDTIT